VTRVKKRLIRRCSSAQSPSCSVAAEALIKNEGVQLRAPCHHGNWMASPTEMQQLREYIGALFVNQQMSE